MKRIIKKCLSLFLIIKIIYILILNRKFKVCLCTVAKLENKYIIEFIEHYKKYGIDKIFIYDNNDINGENFDFLSEYKRINYIEIINYRGKKHPQIQIYRNCYKKNYNKYKWLLFFDVDEFIFLKKYSNIHDYLSKSSFLKCDSIYLNWLIHTDNNLIFYDNRTLSQRFPISIKNKNFCIGKSIIRGNLKGIHIHSCHVLDKKLKICNSFGQQFIPNLTSCKIPDYKYNYYLLF